MDELSAWAAARRGGAATDCHARHGPRPGARLPRHDGATRGTPAASGAPFGLTLPWRPASPATQCPRSPTADLRIAEADSVDAFGICIKADSECPSDASASLRAELQTTALLEAHYQRKVSHYAREGVAGVMPWII